jgi:hypothetical protein
MFVGRVFVQSVEEFIPFGCIIYHRFDRND